MGPFHHSLLFHSFPVLVPRIATSTGFSNVRINFGIVRGLDYYSGIVFEVFDKNSKLGALAGGAIASITIIRIDTWNQFWGNPVIPSILFAALLGITISLLFPSNKVSETEALAILTEEREEMEMSKEDFSNTVK